MVHVSDILLSGDMPKHDSTGTSAHFLSRHSRGPTKFNTHNIFKFFLSLTLIIFTFLGLAYFICFYSNSFAMRNKHILLNDQPLPKDLKPLQYRLQLHPELSNSTFTGSVRILFECRSATRKVILHADNLNLTGIAMKINESDNARFFEKSEKIDIVGFATAKGYLRLRLHDDLKVDRYYVLIITFQGVIGNDFTGLYKSYYTDEFGQKRWLASTLFKPSYARTVFPCFDEPHFKAEFEISLARRTNMLARSNMPLRQTEIMKDKKGWVWDHFKTSPPMSTYLVAFTIFDMKSINISSNMPGPVVKIWVPKNLLSRTKYASSVTSKILNFYYNYLDMKYVLPKLDIIVIPHLSRAGVENWGLISVRESSLLLDEKSDTHMAHREEIFTSLAHYLGHQWFGNLVTATKWSDHWLNEGFSIFLAYLAEMKIRGNHFQDHYLIDIFQKILDNRTESKLDHLMDKKAIYLLRTLHFMLGKNHFRKGVLEYLQKWAYNVTAPEVFWSTLAKQQNFNKHINVMKMIDLLTSQEGYPVVTVTRNTTSVTFQQGEFGDQPKKLWIIPITYKRKQSANIATMYLLDKAQKIDLDLEEDEWILINIHQTGLYRTAYDENNWLLLIGQLRLNHNEIPSSCRAQLINDAFELAKIDQLKYEIAIQLITYMKIQEQDYVVWQTAINGLSFIGNVLLNTEFSWIYNKFLLELMESNINKLDFNFIEDFNPLEELVFKTSCDLKHFKCVQFSTQYLKTLMNGKLQSDHEYSYPILCAAIEAGSLNEWEFVRNLTINSNTSVIGRTNLLLSLGCSTKPWNLLRYLNESIKSENSIEEIGLIWRAIGRLAAGRLVGLKFLETKWYKIQGNADFIDRISREFIHQLSSQSDYERVLSLYNKLTYKVDSLKAAVENIKKKIIWREKCLETLLDIFLKQIVI